MEQEADSVGATGEAMPDQLYRMCPECHASDPGAPCPTCGGERYIPARLDGKGHRRWRLRISTLMLLVAIAGLMSAIVAGWWRAAQEARRRAALMERIVAEDRYFQAIKAKANARSPMPAPSVPTE